MSQEELAKRQEAQAFYEQAVVPQFQERMDANRTAFEQFIRVNIPKERAELILKALSTKTFYIDPAGVAYHSAFPGGLCEHTLKVATKALAMRNAAQQDFDNGLLEPGLQVPTVEETAVAAVLHDTCKIGTYALDTKFKKIGTAWAKYLSYVKDDKLPLGHGEKSIIWCLLKGIQLTKNELLGIRWHMGRYEAGSETSMELKSFYEATKISMLPQILHEADNYAAKFMETCIDLADYAVKC